MAGALKARDIRRQLFVHVYQRRGRGYAREHRKGQPVGLIRAVIGILTEDYHLHVRQLGITKGVEHVFLRWINGLTGLAFSGNKGKRFMKIGLLFLLADNIMPGEGGGHKRSPLFSLTIHWA